MSCGLSATKWRTVRSSTSQTQQNLHRLWRNSRLTGGLSAPQSATHICNPTRTDYFSGQISNLYCGLSALKQRTVHSLTPQNHQRPRCLWTNFKLYGGLFGPPWRTVLSSLYQSTRENNVSRQNSRLYGGSWKGLAS